MTLRSKLIGGLAVWAVFTLIFLACGEGSVWAQDKTAKTATKQKATAAKPSVFKPKVTFVEIGSVNCIPCRAMQPIMNAVEKEYKGQVKIVFHDVWTPKGKEDAMKYNIRVIPTQVFLDINGKEYFRHEGYFPKEQVVEVLKKGGVK